MSYNGFRDVLENYVVGKETYNNVVVDPVVTVVDQNNAIVGFQLMEKGGAPEAPEDAENAFTLVITRVGPSWKIIHIHEG